MLTAATFFRAAALRPTRACVQLGDRPLSQLASTDPNVFGTVDEIFEVDGAQIPVQRYVEADVGMTVRGTMHPSVPHTGGMKSVALT